MSRKLHKFQTEAEYQAYSASTEYTTPCVALIVDTNVIYYDYGNNKPQVDMSNLKVESQEISVGGDYFGDSAITKVHYIPSSITSLDYEVSNWSSLKEVTLLPTTPPSYSSTLYGCSSLESIYVPDESVDTYKTATGWSQFASKFKPLSEKPTE